MESETVRFSKPKKQILYRFETRVDQRTFISLKMWTLFRVRRSEHACYHTRTIDVFEDQAKEIDDALKKGTDKDSQAARPGKAKYVG